MPQSKNNPVLATAEASDRPRLGQRLWQIRKEKKWTLGQVSKMTGVAISTLSKIENEQVDITYDTLMKLCKGLDLSLTNLVEPKKNPFRGGARTVTRKSMGVAISNRQYHYEILSSEILSKNILPVIITIYAHDISEFERMNQHPGEEFVYVIKGKVKLYTEVYEPLILDTGDSAHYDSSMEHALVSESEEDAVVLSICHDGSEGTNYQSDRLIEWIARDVAQQEVRGQ